MWSLITKGIIYRTITEPKIPINVTISEPDKIVLTIMEPDKIEVTVKE